MNLALFSLLAFAGSVLAGVVGSMLGMGGGIMIVPLLTLGFGLDIHLAAGASAVSIIATSSGSAVAYIRDGLTNIRIGTFLNVPTTAGALTGAMMAGMLNPTYLFILFGVLLAYSAVAMFQARMVDLSDVKPDSWAQKLGLNGSYYDHALGRHVTYSVARIVPGVVCMFVSGTIAGLLGIGAGVFKVLAMDQVMRLPIKVSSATSNFMIGVTAAASALIYFQRGEIQPVVAAPVALGVLAGAMLGTRVMVRLQNGTIRFIFIPVLLFISLQMIWKGWKI